MNRTVVALYDTLQDAQQAVQDLVDHGFPRENIGLVASDASGEYARYLTPGQAEVTAGQGAGFGAVVGALTGVIVSLGTLAIPGIGPVIAAGPLVAGLTGAGVGAVAGAVTGGIVAGLVKGGVPEEEANMYAEGIRRGGTLVSVFVTDMTYGDARHVLDAHHPVDIHERAGTWRQQGWTTFQESAEPGTAQQMRDRQTAAASTSTTTSAASSAAVSSPVFDSYIPNYRDNYDTHFADRGYTFDQYLAAYRYGYDLANDARYAEVDWIVVEPDARRRWQDRNPNYSWEHFKEATHYAWDRVRRGAAATAAS
jgi:hypothetical protein